METHDGAEGERGGSNMIIQGIGLRFETLEKYVRVYGSLTAGGGNTCWVSLEALKVASLVEFVWASIVNVNDTVRGGLLETQEIHVLNFWKTIKDEIVLPLMLDLCAKAGLPFPPCLVSLPPELRTKILESLPGVDVAKVECVCKELRKLGNDDELWKHKVGQEFPSAQKWWRKYDVLERQRIKWKKVFHFSSIMAE
ncbi:hypothetical protein M0R45_019722 [Rubus argutus]|uniref:F-box domain-containing protein n=1 Tax=Rubus argutus TaxID=59490 RepID=A0AAW1X7S4_RUBAR